MDKNMKKNSKKYIVQLINVWKRYQQKQVFKNFNIGFEKGKITSILAPSGYGKTTLLNIIAGLDTIDKGQIISNYNNIAYMFQEDRLIPWMTVYDNIAFVLKSYLNDRQVEYKVNKYLNMVELQEYKNDMPRELSGGMKRRVALARTLAYESDFILMDEPFKGLDIKLKNEIMNKVLYEIKEHKKTVVFVTHDIEEANKVSDVIYKNI